MVPPFPVLFGGGWRPQNLGPNLVFWTDPTQLITSGGNIVSASSYGDGFDFEQVISGNRPTLSNKRISFASASSQYLPTQGMLTSNTNATLPDGASGSTGGKGFTGTGLCLAPAGDGTRWASNYGKPLESTAGSTTFASSLVHLSSGTSPTYLSEITAASLGIVQNTTVGGFQGVTGDTLSGNLFAAMPETNSIYEVNPGTGALVNTLTFASANGVAYDPVRDALWVIAAGGPTVNAVLINKSTGAQITSRTLTLVTADCLFVDAQGYLWASGGTNNACGVVIKYDPDARQTVATYTIFDATSIEGFYVDGTTLYVLSDNYYHAIAPALNKILSVTIGNAPTQYGYLGTRLVLAGISKAATVPAATQAVVASGEPLNAGLPGIGVYVASTGEFRIIVGNVTANFTTTITTEFLWFADVDLTAKTASVYFNGSDTPQVVSIGAVTQTNFSYLPFMLGANTNGGVVSRFFNGTLGGAMCALAGAAADRKNIERYLVSKAAA